MRPIVTMEAIEQKIFLVHGQKVMLDSDLAELYGVPTKVLLQAIRRNMSRFPLDFAFQLKNHDVVVLRSQFVTSSLGHGGRRYKPYVFTEQGIAMLSSILNSDRAVEVNIHIMRAFVRLREMIAAHKDLSKKLEELEKKYDTQFKVVFDAIRALVAQPEPKEKKIGFIKERRAPYRTTSADIR